VTERSRVQVLETVSCVKTGQGCVQYTKNGRDPFPEPVYAEALVHRTALLGPYGVDEFMLLKSQQYIIAILIAGLF